MFSLVWSFLTSEKTIELILYLKVNIATITIHDIKITNLIWTIIIKKNNNNNNNNNNNSYNKRNFKTKNYNNNINNNNNDN
jgi:hypothetical protein